MSIPKEDGIIPMDTVVAFAGYTELEEGQAEILTKDMLVKVTGYSEETENYLVEGVDDPSLVDNVFEDELKAAPAPAEEKKPTRARRGKAAAKDEAPAKAKAPAKGKAKPAAKAEEEAPAEEKPAAKTTRKGRAAAKPAAKAEEKPATKPAAAKTEKAGGVVVLSQISELVSDHETALNAAEELAAAIGERTEQLEQSKFQLGGVLCYLKAEEAFKDEGFETINEYCEAKLGLKDRSCETYMQVYTALTEAGVTEKEIDGIGISKLRTVAGVIDKGNRRSLIAAAKKSTRDDLVEKVKEIRKGKSSATDPNATKFKKLPALKLPEDQAEMIESGIEEAMKTFSTDSQAVALYNIVTEWMQGQAAEVPVEDALEALNARYGTDFAFEDEEEATQAA